MKGFTSVECTVAMAARYNYINWCEQTEKLIDELIVKYYNQEFPKKSWLYRKIFKNKAPNKFLLSNLGGFSTYDCELYKVSTKQENKAVEEWCWFSNNKEKSRSIRKLCSASSDGRILVDQELAGFIETWRRIK